MNKADQYYVNHLQKIMEHGKRDENPRPRYKDGTPAHTLFITNVFEEYNIAEGEFPIPTLRNTAIKMGIKEIFWIYQLASNKLEDAHKLGVTWWNLWNVGDQSIGLRYGHTVRRYNLMGNLLSGLKKDLYGRRHIMNLYQEEDLQNGPGLAPCCYETLWSYDGQLNLHLNIRSNDFITAGFINRIQYVALLMMVAAHLGLEPGKFTCYINNLHIYDRHIAAAEEILSREPQNIQPFIYLKEIKDFYSYTIEDFGIKDNVGKKLEAALEIAI